MNNLAKGFKQKAPNFYLKIFIIFIFFNCIFYRDFSYLSFGQNIYITEIFIGLSLITLTLTALFRLNPRSMRLPRPIIFWGLFFVWSSILLVADNNTNIIFKLREFASVYYSLFFVFVILLASSQRDSRLVFKTLLLASFFSALYVIAKFSFGLGNVTTTDLVYRYGNYEFVGILILFSFFFSCHLQADGNKYINIAVLVTCIFVINFLIAHRSGSLAMGLSTIIIIFFLGRSRKSFNSAFLNVTLGVFSIALMMLASPEFAGKALSRIAGVFGAAIYEDPNASWRLEVWKHAVSNMTTSELFHGVGWGYKVQELNFSGRDYSVDGFIGIHNSIVFYFLHTGIIGISLLFVFLSRIYLKSMSAIRSAASPTDKRVITALLASNIGILFFALFNVVLEGPYMSIVFWVTLGLIYNYSTNSGLQTKT